MIKKGNVISLAVLMLLSLSACGKESGETVSKSVSTETTAITTEKAKVSERNARENTTADTSDKTQAEESGTIHEFKSRETTNYILYNGDKVEIVGSAIAESVFNGYYGVSDRDPQKKYQFPEVAPIRNSISYDLQYSGKKKNLSDMPVGITFGRGVYGFGSDMVYGKSCDLKISAGVLCQNSGDAHSKEEEYHQELIGKYGNEEGETLYRKYLQINRMYHAELIYLVEGETKVQTIQCLYSIEGDTIHFQEISVNDNYDVMEQNFSCDLKYRFDGLNLCVTKDQTELVLEPAEQYAYLSNGKKERSVSGVPYGMDGAVDSLVLISQKYYDYGEDEDNKTEHLFFGNYTKGKNANIIFKEDGSFRIQCEHRRKKGSDEMIPVDISGEYIAFGNQYTGVTLIIDHKAYPYTNFYDEYTDLLTAGIVTEEKDLSENEEVAVEIADKKEKAVERVTNAVDDSLGVLINAVSGEATINSGVLFGFDSADLSEDGKQVLDTFFQAYKPIIIELKNEGVISGIQISGYTDSQGGYEYNMNLSQKRADTVKNYLLDTYPDLVSILSAKGLGSEDLVVNADGIIDDDKSRRVSFQMVFSAE